MDVFKGYWKIHDMGTIVEHYFGLWFVHSPNCLTIDQTPVHDILVSVFGNDWRNQVGSKMDVVPMLAGTNHKEALAGCIPYDEAELAEAVTSYGLIYWTLLGQFQHLSQ